MWKSIPNTFSEYGHLYVPGPVDSDMSTKVFALKELTGHSGRGVLCVRESMSKLGFRESSHRGGQGSSWKLMESVLMRPDFPPDPTPGP